VWQINEKFWHFTKRLQRPLGKDLLKYSSSNIKILLKSFKISHSQVKIHCSSFHTTKFTSVSLESQIALKFSEKNQVADSGVRIHQLTVLGNPHVVRDDRKRSYGWHCKLSLELWYYTNQHQNTSEPISWLVAVIYLRSKLCVRRRSLLLHFYC